MVGTLWFILEGFPEVWLKRYVVDCEIYCMSVAVISAHVLIISSLICAKWLELIINKFRKKARMKIMIYFRGLSKVWLKMYVTSLWNVVHVRCFLLFKFWCISYYIEEPTPFFMYLAFDLQNSGPNPTSIMTPCVKCSWSLLNSA